MKGLHDIRLLPALSDGALPLLRVDLASADSLQAAVAYWTVVPDTVGPDLARCLGNTDGFLCVDIHLPTSIDQLAALHAAGANVYLHLWDLSGKTEVGPIKGLPPYLMHAKTLLFDRPDGRASLWSGSHNWTQRALFGVNIELSMVAELDQGIALHQEARSLLAGIRSRCDRFDPGLTAYYKWLQGDDGADNVIELEADDDDDLTGQRIEVFGDEPGDQKRLSKVGNQLYVSVTSNHTGKEVLYYGQILQTGKLRTAHEKADGIVLDERRYAFRRGATLPKLLKKQKIDLKVYDLAYYFVTLALDGRVPDDVQAVDPPDARRWDPVVDDGRMHRLPQQDWTGKKGDRPPKLRRAVSPDKFVIRKKSLDERKQIKGRRLVTRKIVGRGGVEDLEG